LYDLPLLLMVELKLYLRSLLNIHLRLLCAFDAIIAVLGCVCVVIFITDGLSLLLSSSASEGSAWERMRPVSNGCCLLMDSCLLHEQP
jgi:hypothetical protein